MRSPTLTRLYLQCGPTRTSRTWPDERIWEELQTRLAPPTAARPRAGADRREGHHADAQLRGRAAAHGRLFLAGDAAHIVPPTGAKGLNLAVADVRVLAEALGAWYARRRRRALDAYSDRCLRRVWRAQHFSWWMTSMLHRFAGDDAFEPRLQRSQLRYVCSSRAAATTLAENYVGLERV